MGSYKHELELNRAQRAMLIEAAEYAFSEITRDCWPLEYLDDTDLRCAFAQTIFCGEGVEELVIEMIDAAARKAIGDLPHSPAEAASK